MKIDHKNISVFNESLRHESPAAIIAFALQISKKPMVTTSFGAQSAAILHACAKALPDIQVVWCDTGYNTEATYAHANTLIEQLDLNIDIFTPALTKAFIDFKLGIPDPSHPDHEKFTQWVKLEPFKRALKKHTPDVWFTNLRKEQNTFRNTLDVLSFSKEGVLKVSPFFHYSEKDITAYLKAHQLPVEADYYDPVKASAQRECGIHFN